MGMPLKILFYGYGNPGRQDDGLGNAFINEMEQWTHSEGIDGIELDSNYQLNIEDAYTIAGKDVVIFVDASTEPIRDFSVTRVDPSDAKVEFTMHSVSSSFVLDLCNKIFGKNPMTFLLHIKGYHWDFKEGISGPARKNLNKALKFVQENLRNPERLSEFLSDQIG